MEEVSLFLSPHLDDAVLSCAGQILTESQAGRRVVVATIFSNGNETEQSCEYYERRRAEDSVATEVLGAEPVWLGLRDAPCRRDFYRNFREIVFDTHPDDVGHIEQVVDAIQGLCTELEPTRVYAPLGVGTHIDHRLTHEAVRSLPEATTATYYEDRPYALIRFAVQMRVFQLGAAWDGVHPSENSLKTEFLKSFDHAHWTHTYLPAGPERERCKAQLVAELLRVGTESNTIIRAETRTYSAPVFAYVLEAATAYSSQLFDLFAGHDDFMKQTRCYTDHLASGSHYAERYWSFRKKPGFLSCAPS